MEIWGTFAVLARRFYLTVPLLALMLVGAYSLTHKTAPQYHASASMVLLGPTSGAALARNTVGPLNPYIGAGMDTVANTIELDASNPRSLSEVIAAHDSPDYSVSTLPRSSVLSITATSQNPRQALSTVAQLISIAQADLLARQKPYASQASDQVTAQVLATPQLQAADTKPRLRAEAIGVGCAVVLTIMLVLLIDSAATRTRRGTQPPDTVAETGLEGPGQPRTSAAPS